MQATYLLEIGLQTWALADSNTHNTCPSFTTSEVVKVVS